MANTETALYETEQFKAYDEQFGEVIAKLLVVYADKGQTYKSFETQLAAADGDKDAAIQNYMDNSDDAQVVKLRTQIENAQKRLRELAEKNVQTEELSEADREKLNKQMEELKVELRAGEKAVTDVAGMLNLDTEAVSAEIAKIGNPAKSHRGRKAGEAGSKLPRTSVNVTVNGGNLKDAKYPSFSPLAQLFKVDVADLQKAFAEAAGVKHEDIKTVKTPVEFNFQPHENGAVYTIHTEPKDRKPRGSSASDETETEEKSDGPTGEPNFEEAAKSDAA